MNPTTRRTFLATTAMAGLAAATELIPQVLNAPTEVAVRQVRIVRAGVTLVGLRPFAEIMPGDLITVCSNEEDGANRRKFRVLEQSIDTENGPNHGLITLIVKTV